MPKHKKKFTKLKHLKLNKDLEKDTENEDLYQQDQYSDDGSDVYSANTENKKYPSFLNFTKNEDEIHDSNVEGDYDFEEPESGNKFASFLGFGDEAEADSGMARVKKKSNIFLILNLLSFSLLSFVGLYFFQINLLITIFVVLFYIVVTNIFYIIVPEKSYVWLSLAGQLLILPLVNVIVTSEFNIITLFGTFILIIFNYFAFSELEKFQLGVRLFSIKLVAAETNRIMTIVAAIIISLGVFNQIVSSGPDLFFRDVVYENDFAREWLIFGNGPIIGANDILIRRIGDYDPVYNPIDLNDFLVATAEATLTPAERERALDVDAAQLEKATQVNEEMYGELGLNLDTTLDRENFYKVVRQYYMNLIIRLTSQQEDVLGLENYMFIERGYLIPAFLSLGVFMLLFVIRFFTNWFFLLVTWSVWKILKTLGFAEVEVETVDAEVVSI